MSNFFTDQLNSQLPWKNGSLNNLTNVNGALSNLTNPTQGVSTLANTLGLGSICGGNSTSGQNNSSTGSSSSSGGSGSLSTGSSLCGDGLGSSINPMSSLSSLGTSPSSF